MSESTPSNQATIDVAPAEAQPHDIPTFHHVDNVGRPLRLDGQTAAQSEAAVLKFRDDFSIALEDMPSHVENLDIKRVNEFLKRQGIEPTSFKVIDEQEVAELGELYKKTLEDNDLGRLYDPFEFDVERNTSLGWHDQTSGQTFVIRPYMREIENGADITESIIVHEQFHTASGHNNLVIVHDDSGDVIHAGNARAGLFVTGKNIPFAKSRVDSNFFLEEAAACYFEAQYKKEFTPTRLKRLVDAHRGVGVPYEYTNFSGGEVSLQNSYGTAGYAMDLMIQEKPELLDAIVESRKSVQGLRDTARIINEIKPGLYGALSRIDPTKFDQDNLGIIIAAIRGIDDQGHEMLRTERNPNGHVEGGFVSSGERAVYKTANRRKAEGRLARIVRKAFENNAQS